MLASAGSATYNEQGGMAAEPAAPPSLQRRLGRLLRLPGVPRRPRWSEIWPSGEAGGDDEEGT